MSTQPTYIGTLLEAAQRQQVAVRRTKNTIDLEYNGETVRFDRNPYPGLDEARKKMAAHFPEKLVQELLPEPRDPEAVKPYLCPECGAAFSRPNLMGSHRRHMHGRVGTHAGVHPCPTCGKTYTRRDSLKLHHKRRHGAPLPKQPEASAPRPEASAPRPEGGILDSREALAAYLSPLLDAVGPGAGGEKMKREIESLRATIEAIREVLTSERSPLGMLGEIEGLVRAAG